MKTILLSQNEIKQAALLLKKGELVAFPTETVYGLGACISQPDSIKKIFKVKKRPQDNPLIAHIATLEECNALAIEIPNMFFQLAEAFFPGPLTLVIQKHPSISSIVSGGLNTIAIRMPAHSIARALIAEVGEALVAPSANLSGTPSSTRAEHVMEDFQGKIAAVIDGGDTVHGMESTVIDLVTFGKPTLLRHGALSKEEVESVLSQKLDLYTSGPKSSPGMKYRHYAPKLPVYLFSKREDLQKFLLSKPNSLILSTESLPILYHPLEAKTLYATLRFADQKGYDQIVILCKDCEDATLLNRLEKIVENHLH